MKRCLWLATVSFVLLMSFGMLVQAQPKEVSEAVTTTYYVTARVLPLGEGRIAMNYEGTGITLATAGKGLFHEATVRAFGSMSMDKGKINDERGWGVWNLQNGDKVFFTYTWAGEVKPEGTGEAKGMVTITGGTGKCAGIKGSFPISRRTVKSAVEGVGQSYVSATITYTLP